MKNCLRSLLVVALVFGVALGDGWGGDRKGRDIDVKSTKDIVEIKGRKRGAAGADALSFKFSTKGVPHWVLSYFHRDSDTKASTTSRWSLWKLVEYTESGAALGFQPEVDTIAKEYRLWLQSWSDMTVAQTTVDNATVYSFCTEMRTTNRDGDTDKPNGPPSTIPFVLRICNFIANQPATINGTRASPNAMKWSLEISDYPYANNNTHLALKVAFDSESEVRNFKNESGPVRSSTQDALEVSSDGNITTAITWATNVDLEGTDCPATADITRSAIYTASVKGDTDTDAPRGDSSSWTKSVRLAYFSFLTDCQPSTIFWDPEFGVVTPVEETNVVENSASKAAIVVGLTLLMALIL